MNVEPSATVTSVTRLLETDLNNKVGGILDGSDVTWKGWSEHINTFSQ